MKALYGVIFFWISFISTTSYGALYFIATNPTCTQPYAPINYSVGVTRFLADYHVLVVENDHVKHNYRTTPTRLALQLVDVKRTFDTEIYTDKDGKMNFTIVHSSAGSIGTLNWNRDLAPDMVNVTFECQDAGNIFFELNPKTDSRLSVGN